MAGLSSRVRLFISAMAPTPGLCIPTKVSQLKSDADALCLRVEGDETTIKGSGSLAITTSITTNRASAIEITKQNATLTFNEATVSATAGFTGGLPTESKLRAVRA